MRVVGLDLSLTSTGVALADGSTLALCAPVRKMAKGTKRTVDDDMARLRWLRQEIAEHTFDADLVVIEGYSFGSGAGRERAGELGGIIRLDLWEHCRPWVTVAPRSLKLFATDKGDADKTTVALRARDLGWAGFTNDEADAAFLRWIGLYAHGIYDVPHTAYRDAVIAKLGWSVTRAVPSVDSESEEVA